MTPTLRPDLATEKYPHVIEYECSCGKKKILYQPEKIDIIVRCFDCQNDHESTKHLL